MSASEQAKCKVKFIRQSPYKMRFVLDSVRGKKVDYALDFLKFSNKKAAKFISKALNSAVSNYSQTKENFDSDLLYVKEAYVDEGPKIKRFRPRAMGRAAKILKRTSHLTVVIGEKG
tara:strand:- start:857 stop:1207 length:351 start_codon:yes stop_codon:yes gene_type:complete